MHIAYLAGLFDGEGSVCLTANREIVCQLRITIANTHLATLSEIPHQYGGKIFDTYAGRRKPCYVWYNTNRPQVLKFISDIMPYTKIKLEQLRIALWFLMTPTYQGRHSPQFIVDMKRAMKRAITAWNRRPSFRS